MKALFIFALILYVRGENICENKSVDECIDIVIENATQKIPHPAIIPDFETHVVTRGIEFTEGVLWGIDKLQRIGSMELRGLSTHFRVILGYLGIDMISARYKWTSTFRNHIRSGYVVFRASNITIYTGIEPNFDPIAHPIVDHFEIQEMVVDDIGLSGLGYLTWIASTLTDYLKKKITDIVKSFIENKVRIALQKEFYQIQFDVDWEKLFPEIPIDEMHLI